MGLFTIMYHPNPQQNHHQKNSRMKRKNQKIVRQQNRKLKALKFLIHQKQNKKKRKLINNPMIRYLHLLKLDLNTIHKLWNNGDEKHLNMMNYFNLRERHWHKEMNYRHDGKQKQIKRELYKK